MINVLMFAFIVYILVDLPLEPDRITWFCLLALALSLCSQGLGYAIGASFNILVNATIYSISDTTSITVSSNLPLNYHFQNGSVVAPHILALLLALAVYGMGYKTGIEPLMKVLMSTSYLRFGLVGFSGTLFNDRKPMECMEIYCHYRHSELVMEDMGMSGTKPYNQFLIIMGFMVLFRFVSYLSLKYSMTSELRNTIVHYAAKIVRQKEP